MLSVPALLRTDKTCCWWLGAKASSTTEPAKGWQHQSHTQGAPRAENTVWGAGMGTPALAEVLEAVAAQRAEVWSRAEAAAGSDTPAAHSFKLTLDFLIC